MGRRRERRGGGGREEAIDASKMFVLHIHVVGGV